MKSVFRTAARVARFDVPVLITGETGTGKTTLARRIHEESRRCGRRFVHLNCAAVPSSLAEAELFGCERGAYTGAIAQRKGRFEVAEGGTLLLDEVGELEVSLQSKLLKVLEDGSFERLGSSEERRADVRIIAATSRDLANEVSQGRFRKDLYFRLAGVHICVPPLRDRTDEISSIVSRAWERLNTTYGESRPLDPDWMQVLVRRKWPGNVRELLAAVEREWIGIASDSSGTTTDLRSEEERIKDTLKATGGNIARAARRLGVPRSTLRHKMAKHRVDRTNF